MTFTIINGKIVGLDIITDTQRIDQRTIGAGGDPQRR
jgi:hypothetical protein